jgi:Helix-turn-helix domain
MQTSQDQGYVDENDGVLLTPAAAARALGISRKSVSEAIKAGRLKARNLAPRVWLIDPADVEAYRQRARRRKRPQPHDGPRSLSMRAARGRAPVTRSAHVRARGQHARSGPRCRQTQSGRPWCRRRS